MRTDKLTRREADILTYIIQFKTINGYAPTLTEISEALYTSRTFVRQCIFSLDAKGYIRYREDKRRSIVVLKIPEQKIS